MAHVYLIYTYFGVDLLLICQPLDISWQVGLLISTGKCFDCTSDPNGEASTVGRERHRGLMVTHGDFSGAQDRHGSLMIRLLLVSY